MQRRRTVFSQRRQQIRRIASSSVDQLAENVDKVFLIQSDRGVFGESRSKVNRLLMISRADGPTLSPAAIAMILVRTTAREVFVLDEDVWSRCDISVSTTV